MKASQLKVASLGRTGSPVRRVRGVVTDEGGGSGRSRVGGPESTAKVKLDSIRALGAKIVMHSFADWWSIMSTHETGADDGVFIHPVCEPSVILGNGTIGLELAEDWPELDTVVIPFGGGGLS